MYVSPAPARPGPACARQRSGTHGAPAHGMAMKGQEGQLGAAAGAEGRRRGWDRGFGGRRPARCRESACPVWRPRTQQPPWWRPGQLREGLGSATGVWAHGRQRHTPAGAPLRAGARDTGVGCWGPRRRVLSRPRPQVLAGGQCGTAPLRVLPGAAGVPEECDPALCGRLQPGLQLPPGGGMRLRGAALWLPRQPGPHAECRGAEPGDRAHGLEDGVQGHRPRQQTDRHPSSGLPATLLHDTPITATYSLRRRLQGPEARTPCPPTSSLPGVRLALACVVARPTYSPTRDHSGVGGLLRPRVQPAFPGLEHHIGVLSTTVTWTWCPMFG